MVKGYAEQEVLADQGNLTVRVSKNDLMPRPTKPLKHRFRWSRTSLLSFGEEAEMLELSTSISETKKLNEKGNRTNEIDYYVVSVACESTPPRCENWPIFPQAL